MGLIIRQGQIWYKNIWFYGDIFIKEGIIQKIDEVVGIEGNNFIEIDAKGMIIIPGLIDLHVHFREPGYENKETIETGSKAALKGGFTTVALMPNTAPIIDNPQLIDLIINKGKELELVKLLPIGAITLGEKGEELADFQGMKEKGALGFSDDGKGLQSALLMEKAMEKAKEFNLPIIAHCEDKSLFQEGVIHKGKVAEKLNIPGIPSEAEYIQLARDLMLAETTGVHYHLCHISTKESINLIREAKAKGINVTAEVTPHHLLLSEDDLKEPLANYKMNPPLRMKKDRLSLIEGILDGTIDFIATDHAPHTAEEKKQGILDAPFGIVGLETAFPLLYTKLVKTKILKLEELINLMSTKPAKLFSLKGGIIDIGQTADLTIIDVNTKKKVDPRFFHSKGKNTPFIGWELFGWPIYTIVDGEIRWKEEGLY